MTPTARCEQPSSRVSRLSVAARLSGTAVKENALTGETRQRAGSRWAKRPITLTSRPWIGGYQTYPTCSLPWTLVADG